MKWLFILLLLSEGYKSVAQHNGYYVTLQHDTVPAVILVKRDVFGPYSVFSLYKEAKIKDGNGGEIVLKPGDIHSFYVETHIGNYHFYPKPLKNSQLRFLEAVTLSSKANLYGYRPGGMNTGGAITAYTLERADGSFEFIENELYVKAKKKLTAFFKDEPAILAHLQKLFKKPGFEHSDLQRLFKKIALDYPLGN